MWELRIDCQWHNITVGLVCECNVYDCILFIILAVPGACLAETGNCEDVCVSTGTQPADVACFCSGVEVLKPDMTCGG